MMILTYSWLALSGLLSILAVGLTLQHFAYLGVPHLRRRKHSQYYSVVFWFFSAVSVLLAFIILTPLTLFTQTIGAASTFFTLTWITNLVVIVSLAISAIALRQNFLPNLLEVLKAITRKRDTLVLPVDAKFVLNQPVPFEERRNYEFKEIKGSNPIDTIKNTVDEYAVAFLNSEGGRIFWGIQNDDRLVSGISLVYAERDKLRRLVTEQLNGMQPALDPTRYRIELHPIYDAADATILDRYIVEVVIPEVKSWTPYYTASGETFVMVDGVKKRLGGPALTDWILRRDKQRRSREER
jgi:Putative DNA-binding domain